MKKSDRVGGIRVVVREWDIVNIKIFKGIFANMFKKWDED